MSVDQFAMASTLETQPPAQSSYILSYPAPHVLLITINRPTRMNSLPYASHWEAEGLMSWFDAEPSLRVAVVTGAGEKAFSAGQDLIEQGETKKKPLARQMMMHPPSGFMAISRRTGKKPVIAAVNGFALGGGFEIVLGCDMVVASPTASFGLPEAKRGLYAGAGGLSRLVRITGLPIATEIAVAGRVLTASEAFRFNIINKVSVTPATLIDETIALAASIGDMSPDAVIVTRSGLRESLEQGSVERASQITQDKFGRALAVAPNMMIGLEAFAKKQKPNWVPSKL
ncbi:enoyl-CoA hydratase-like protein [Tothia fuscella]|uniref:Enoyl-CoA hydratase-like protein n=1 Tax=Tothia fuscella TaxID=1048955 RepID=A0A9P4NLN5_9PEZI|nr:enoyl-CoA hydratase-like protein [Tothia fuscella]